jgi:hypothetical protein
MSSSKLANAATVTLSSMPRSPAPPKRDAVGRMRPAFAGLGYRWVMTVLVSLADAYPEDRAELPRSHPLLAGGLAVGLHKVAVAASILRPVASKTGVRGR